MFSEKSQIFEGYAPCLKLRGLLLAMPPSEDFTQPHCTSSMGQVSPFGWHFSEIDRNVFLLLIYLYTNIFKAQLLFCCYVLVSRLANGGERTPDQ